MILRELPVSIAIATALLATACSEHNSAAKEPEAPSHPAAQPEKPATTANRDTRIPADPAPLQKPAEESKTLPPDPVPTPPHPVETPTPPAPEPVTPPPPPSDPDDLTTLPADKLPSAAMVIVERVELALGRVADDASAKDVVVSLGHPVDQLDAVKSQLAAQNFDWTALKKSVDDVRAKFANDPTVGESLRPLLERIDKLSH